MTASLAIADDTAAKADRRVRDDVRQDCLAYLLGPGAGLDDDAARAGCRRVLLRHHRELFKPRVKRLETEPVARERPDRDPPPWPFGRTGGRAKVERDLVIAACLAHGLTQNHIARVLGMTQSRVSAVAARFEAAGLVCAGRPFRE